MVWRVLLQNYEHLLGSKSDWSIEASWEHWATGVDYRIRKSNWAWKRIPIKSPLSIDIGLRQKWGNFWVCDQLLRGSWDSQPADEPCLCTLQAKGWIHGDRSSHSVHVKHVRAYELCFVDWWSIRNWWWTNHQFLSTIEKIVSSKMSML